MLDQKALHRLYPLLVGSLLGLVQTGLFFQLSFTFSSSFRTYVMMVVFWLMGSVIGLRLAAKWSIPTVGFLMLALLAYAVASFVLHQRPFESGLGFLYSILIIIIGVYPGVFFARMSQVYRAQQLFFQENNGFILGLVAGTLLFMLLGRVGIWASPILVAGPVSVLGMNGSKYNNFTY